MAEPEKRSSRLSVDTKIAREAGGDRGGTDAVSKMESAFQDTGVAIQGQGADAVTDLTQMSKGDLNALRAGLGIRSEAVKDEVMEPSTELLSEERMVVTCNGVPRTIRLDLQEGDGEADRLNDVVREVKRTALHRRNVEMSRQVKMRALNRDVGRLSLDRGNYSMEVPGWQPTTWRDLNVRKTRAQPSNVLLYVTPERRRAVLHRIEHEVLQHMDRHPGSSSSATGQLPSLRSPGRQIGVRYWE